LKEVRGALITLIDHDAPAAQVGLRVNDVVLQVNGQTVEGAEAFGRIMREIPPGRKISLVFSRDGAIQTIAVQLADHHKMESDIWDKLNRSSDISSSVQGTAYLPNGAVGDPLPTPNIPVPWGGRLNVGVIVEPLNSQTAEYLGVENGLMVRQVSRKSEAAAAGMRAHDVILKVGTESISTVSDWERAMRANQGKSVAVTILRDKKQQTLTLEVDSKRKGEIEFYELLPDGPCPLMAFADSDAARDLMDHLQIDESAVQSMQNQAEALEDQIEQWKNQAGEFHFGVTPEQAEEFRKQAEQFRDAFKDKNFGIDQKQMDELKKQMEQFRHSFDANQFKLDQKQMDEMKKQMEQFHHFQAPGFDEQQREQMKEQMDQLKRQMEQMRALGFDHLG
jgi:C-terminal processing protease CtpA/Prc